MSNLETIVAEAREHFEAALLLPMEGFPGEASRWSHLRADMATFIRDAASLNAVIRFAQHGCSFDHRMSYDGWEHFGHLYFNALSYEYPEFRAFIGKFAESPVSIPESCKVIDGTPVSNVSLFHSTYILTNLSFNSKIDSLCEIGGGYGGPARLWLTNPIRQACKYVILDLPESLFFAECFLRASLPDVKLTYAVSRNEIRQFKDADKGVMLCPIAHNHYCDELSFDLITNTGSLGELSDEWAGFWGNWLGRQNAARFYSFNYFGNPHTKLFEGRNILSPIVPTDWQLGFIRINHALVHVQSVERNGAELIFTRTPGRPRGDSVFYWLKSLGNLRLSLRELAYYVFNLPSHVSFEPEYRMVQKILSDFSYIPKELIFLLGRLINSGQVDQAAPVNRTAILQLHEKLLREYRDAFPRGTGVE